MKSMSTTLLISENVINKLVDLNEPLTLKLYGVFHKNTLIILGLQHGSQDDSHIAFSFPTEVDYCGIASADTKFQNKQSILKCFADVDVTDNPILVKYEPRGGQEKISVHLIINDNIETSNYTVVTERELQREFALVRVEAEVPFTSELSTDAIKSAFTALRTSVATGRMVFHFPDNNVYLLGNSDTENSLVNTSGDPCIRDMSQGTDEDSTKRNRTHNREYDILQVNMLQRVTRDGSPVNSRNHAPLCILDKKFCKTVNIIIPVDALAMLHKKTRLTNLYEILVETVNRNLRLYERTLLKYLQQNIDDTANITFLEVFHFYVDECGHFITLVYPSEETEEEVAQYDYRVYIHNQFLLPLTKPFFRKSNKYSFYSANKCGELLINPHENLKPTDNEGTVAIVTGKYVYYHYGQDNNLDDKGWGCAYRSLQTLASWFILQGYTNKRVPTFREIQRCLVDIADKQSDFIGSRNWIGSTEVSYVLNIMFGVTSKILYVSSGDEMADKGGELLHHFQTHGSPIMIGGGVLAHTILGVDYNRNTGDIRFLILDPHYNGMEDINIIQNKGWCGWKDINFWDKTAYYNMCMPQVPITI